MRLPLFALAALCVSSLAAHADTVYTYTGQYFNQVTGDYTTSDKITGELTFSAPLPDNLAFQQAIPESYSFSDGLQTLTPANSILNQADASTDSSGSITRYDYIGVTTGGYGIEIMTSYEDAAYSGPTPDYTGLSTASANPGSFSGPQASTGVTPEPSSIALLGTGMLGLAGVVRKRFA